MLTRDFDIIQGDDYAEADGRALVFTSAGKNWPDLSSATLAFKVALAGSDDPVIFSAGATRTVASGVQKLSVPLTAAQTNLLQQGTNAYEYALQATLSGRRLTLEAGYLSVRGDV